jgi:predicted DCC family thiol-disulfide oxidoreductase YuxK
MVGWIALGYYLPGIRQLCDALYRWVARNRYRLFRKQAEPECASGACAVHFRTPPVKD